MKRERKMNPWISAGVNSIYLTTQRFLLVFVASLFLTPLFGCNVNNQIKGRYGSGSTGNDFGKSEIVVNGTGIADGSTPLYVLVRLVNSDGSVIAGFRPEYQILSGSGVITAPCTLSDVNGVAVCALKANLPGMKSMKVTNLGVTLGLQSSFEFIAVAAKGSVAGLSSSGSAQQVASGYLVHASVSGWTSSIYQETGSGYKVYTSLQGSIDSE